MNDEPVDLRVGVLAARTFIIRAGRFRPLNAGLSSPFIGTSGTDADKTWWNAAATATCWAPVQIVNTCECGCAYTYHSYDTTRHPDHAVPEPACTCGIYSFSDAQEVAAQYGPYAAETLAVIAPEGQAMEGTRGWRAEKATILAAWVKSDDARSELRGNYPTVRFYAEIADLFRDHPAIDNGGLQKYRDILAQASRYVTFGGGGMFTFTGNSFVLSNPTFTVSSSGFAQWIIPATDTGPDPVPETLEEKAAKALDQIAKEPLKWAKPLTDPTCPDAALAEPFTGAGTITDQTGWLRPARPKLPAAKDGEPYYRKRPNGRWAA